MMTRVIGDYSGHDGRRIIAEKEIIGRKFHVMAMGGPFDYPGECHRGLSKAAALDLFADYIRDDVTDN